MGRGGWERGRKEVIFGAGARADGRGGDVCLRLYGQRIQEAEKGRTKRVVNYCWGSSLKTLDEFVKRSCPGQSCLASHPSVSLSLSHETTRRVVVRHRTSMLRVVLRVERTVRAVLRAVAESG